MIFIFAVSTNSNTSMLFKLYKELGAAAFALVLTEFTNEKVNQVFVDKLQMQAIEAAEQCER